MRLFILSFLLIFTQTVLAEFDSWKTTVTPQFMFGIYNDSPLRDTIYNLGVFLTADYLDSGGLSFGYNYSYIEGKTGNQEGFNSVDESAFYVSGVFHSYPDSLSGKLSYRLDAYYISDTTSVTETTTIQPPPSPSPMISIRASHNSGGSGNFKTPIYYSNESMTVNPMLTFANSAATYNLELGYAYSDYRYGETSVNNNQVHQLAPMFGFGFNEKYDWIQMRAYFIHLTDTSLTHGEADFNSLAFKWKHWFKATSNTVNNMGIDILLGKRMLAVDPDAAMVYSLADQETGAIAIHWQWVVSEVTKYRLQFGYEQYEDLLVGNDYNIVYTYFNFSHQW